MPDLDRPRRRNSLRLPGYDYAQTGAYFITIVVRNRQEILGQVLEDQCCLSSYGKIVHSCWVSVLKRYPTAISDASVVMPNHFHAIVIIEAQTDGRVSISRLIAHFKYQSTKEVNLLRNTPGKPLWQRGFHDHIIRNEADCQKIYEYIEANPIRWMDDILRTKDIPESKPKTRQ